MKKNALAEIKVLNIGELRDRMRVLQQEVAVLTMDKNMKKLKDLKSVGKKRKDLAQVQTVLRTKQLLDLIEAEGLEQTAKEGRSAQTEDTKSD